jgi:hypothetical protein
MITLTFLDRNDGQGAVTLAYEGTVDDVKAGDAQVDQAIATLFQDGTVQLVYGSCVEGDPVLEFWRRQVGRLVHTHPLVGSTYAEWIGTSLVWHWQRSPTPLTRRAPWAPFCTRAVWEADLARAAVVPQDIENKGDSSPGVRVTRNAEGRAVGMTRT